MQVEKMDKISNKNECRMIRGWTCSKRSGREVKRETRRGGISWERIVGQGGRRGIRWEEGEEEVEEEGREKEEVGRGQCGGFDGRLVAQWPGPVPSAVPPSAFLANAQLHHLALLALSHHLPRRSLHRSFSSLARCLFSSALRISSFFSFYTLSYLYLPLSYILLLHLRSLSSFAREPGRDSTLHHRNIQRPGKQIYAERIHARINKHTHGI